MKMNIRFKIVALVLSVLIPATAAEPIRVLPAKIDGRPAEEMVAHYLLNLAVRQLDARRKQMEKITTPEQLRQRQAYVKKTIVGSFGGFPERTPLNGRVVGRLEREDYVVEKVIFESRPNFHVTAALYLPKQGKHPLPGVVVPCGHSPIGKACEAYQRACILLVKNGFAVLCYDPISQGERMQTIDENGKVLIRSSTEEHSNIGIGALLVGSNTAGIRIWDGMRAIDYLQSRDEVDPDRIGVTGNSGGGTMTSYLMCLDDRVKAAAPSCFLTSYERLLKTIGCQDAEQNFTGFLAAGLDHADFVERMAPKPVLISTATHDFFDITGTWHTYREAKRFYGRFGFAERVDLIEAEDKHGFSKPRRVAVVRWMRRWLMDAHDPIDEPDFEIFPTGELQCTKTGQVLTSLKGRTAYDLNGEIESKLSAKRKAAFNSTDRKAWLERVAELIGAAENPVASKITEHGKIGCRGYTITKLSFSAEGLVVPGLLCVPDGKPGRKPAVIYTNGDGMAGDAGEQSPIAALASAGRIVLAVDLPGMGETAKAKGKKAGHDRRFGPDWPAVFLGFLVGKTHVGLRCDAVRAAVNVLGKRNDVDAKRIDLIAVNNAVIPALHAAALDQRIRAVITEGGLESYAMLVKQKLSDRMLHSVVPDALTHYDLPMLAEAIKPRKVRRTAPADPMRRFISDKPSDVPNRFVNPLKAGQQP